jgi:error-prone DNA polymerase
MVGRAGGCQSERVTCYAELHCKTNFSFLRGASHPDELVNRAAELGYAALAITDRNSLAGVVRGHVAAKAAGLKLLIGAEITPQDGPALLLYAPDRAAYGRLARLITRGCLSAVKGDCLLRVDDIAAHAEGLLAVVVGLASGGRQPPVTVNFRKHRVADARRSLDVYREIFGDRCYLALTCHLAAGDEQRLEYLQLLVRQVRLPPVATNDVHYHEPRRRYLQDVLTAIREGRTVAELGALRFPNGERYLKSPAQMAALFHSCPEAIDHVLALAGRCTFSLDELRYEYPEELCPPQQTPVQYLNQLTWQGARRRYPDGIPGKVRELLARELRLIEELHYEAFFLTVWDLVRFARSREILCQGRGSAANSAVCYCLGITSVDPDRTDVLFERFISRERAEAPDIDVDFEHEQREQVIQYVYEKYGRDRAGIAAEVITYRPRSAVREVGKALGLSLDRVDVLAKVFDEYGNDPNWTARVRETGMDPRSPLMRQLVWLARELLGFPRHLSQHVGGFVITRGPLSELVPIENAAMPDRTMIEWDKDDLDALGLLKVDCLALGMLTAIHKCFDLIEGSREDSGFRVQGPACSPESMLNPESGTLNAPLTLASIPAEDPAVYDMICRADTVGVFQIESRAQMSMLPRLRPRCFYDLVIEVAIVRPGPIQGGMVHPYLRRRHSKRPVAYPTPEIEQVLGKTLGVPLFQEQVMRLAMVAAGYSAGQADQLRRAMGAWRRPGLLEQFRTSLRDGMRARGYPASYAEEVFNQIRGFGEYGFPESHAASFALLAYVSAWLKYHYPAAFVAALLNSQPMGFYAPAQLVRDAREHGVQVRPIDINHSDWDCTLEPVIGSATQPSPLPLSPRAERGGISSSERWQFALRLGFRLIKGLPESTGRMIAQARGGRPFSSLTDFVRRTGLSKPLLVRLSAADTFGSLGLNRRTALWQILSVEKPPALFARLDTEEETPVLADMPLYKRVVADYQTVGLSLTAHPLSLVRSEMGSLGVVAAAGLAKMANNASVNVAGLVLVRQQPGTAKGIVFVTLEDETGIVNLIVRPAVWQRYRSAARAAVALFARGRLQRSQGVIHVLPTELTDLSSLIPQIASASRDFC